MTTDVDGYLDGLRVRFTLAAYIRRAQANRLHNAWLEAQMAEQADRRERMDTIMDDRDYMMAGRHLLTAADRATVRAALEKIPTNVRAELGMAQDRLSTVQAQLGAEPRRRVAEIRCWLYDALEHLDALEVYECRQAITDAVHQLEFMLTHFPQNDRPSRSKLERDHRLRQTTQMVVNDLRRLGKALA